MQFFESTSFFIAAGIACVIAFMLGLFQFRIKYYGLLVSVGFAVWAMIDSPMALLYMGIYIIFEFLIIQIFLSIVRKKGKHEERGRHTGAYYFFLTLSILPVFLNKVLGLFDISFLGFLGISYMTFKSIQIVMEIYDGLIVRQNFVNFVYLLLFFPSLLSGPIDRSRRFESDVIHNIRRKVYLEMVGDGLFQMVLGYAYKFVFADFFFQYVSSLEHSDMTFSNCYIYMFVYGIYLFFDFAGYSLMAIGMGKIFGVNLPMNFNKPFISVDIKDFWNRWHISLSHWFRDFVFSRLMMKCIKNKWFKDKVNGAAFCLIINMTIMGLWHGLTLSYILYGFYHGVLLAVVEKYQKKSKFHKRNKKKVWYKFLSWIINIHFVMFGFFIFSGRFILLFE